MSWPPAGAVRVPFDNESTGLSAPGFAHGTPIRGVRQLWRRDDALFAEVELPASDGVDQGRFRIHPALLHAALLLASPGRPADTSSPPEERLPFRCRGIRLDPTRG
ncbi:polyketide synthase dehydratase domain-containing protein, partial [Streptomyces lancefieldiae]|uniref:polyketide synthase dehydratase domain-containing protein n=1 Tax=Streptomyces lancefieldiae TaxID=3075520 RepID=UPI00374E1A75